jgi:predicted Na+-dependent transporter
LFWALIVLHNFCAEVAAMWQRYRKTFFGMQVFIWTICLGAWPFFGPKVALTLLVVMQWSAIVGAVWGTRIARFAERRAARLPLRPVG